MKPNLLHLLLALLPFTTFAQVATTTYYFDKDLNLSSKSKSSYSGEGKWEGGNYRLDLYRNKNHYHVFAAHYTDSTFATMNGQFVSYYENGVVENVMYYKDGRLAGLSVRWATDHKIMDSTWYRNGAPDSAVIYNYNFLNRKLTSVIRDNYIDSSTVQIRYDAHENPIEADASDSTSAERLVVITNPDEEAAFPGDDSTMNSYFQYRFSQHRFNLILQGTSEACALTFIIDKNGRASDVQSIYCDNNALRNYMADAVRDIVWLPAIKNGKSVASVKQVAEIYSPSITGLTSDNQRRYFFDDNFNAVPEEDAPYFGKLTKEGNLVKLTVHYKQHSNRIFSMHFTDSTLQIATGEFESFYSDDQKEVRGNFLMGRKDGLWLEWSDQGQVVDSSLYVNRVKTYEVLTRYQPQGTPGMRLILDYLNNKKREIFFDRRNVIYVGKRLRKYSKACPRNADSNFVYPRWCIDTVIIVLLFTLCNRILTQLIIYYFTSIEIRFRYIIRENREINTRTIIMGIQHMGTFQHLPSWLSIYPQHIFYCHAVNIKPLTG